MTSKRNLRMVKKALSGQVPSPFSLSNSAGITPLREEIFNETKEKFNKLTKIRMSAPLSPINVEEESNEKIAPPIGYNNLQVHSSGSDTQKNLVDISLAPQICVAKPVSLKTSLSVNPLLLKELSNLLQDNKQQKNNEAQHCGIIFQGSNLVTEKPKMQSDDHKNESQVKKLAFLCSEAVIALTKTSRISSVPVNLINIGNVQVSSEDNDFSESDIDNDFSETDTDDDFVPKRNKKKRMRLITSSHSNTLSSSSSDSTSSSSSSSSSSYSFSAKKGKKRSTNVNSDSSSDSFSSLSSLSPVKRGKKRSRNIAAWKRNRAKLLKNTGKEYISRTGKTVKAKELKPPCSNKCRLSCATKFTTSDRQKTFDNFWSLSSFQRQRDYLSTCVSILQVSVRRIKTGTTKQRQPNCCFSFLRDGKVIRVCKTFLLNTLAITERILRTVIAAKSSGSGITPVDGRGKHPKRIQDPEVVRSVRDHINSIPRVESHYLRANTSREFIDGGLTIAEMHRHYKQQRESLNKVSAKYEYYAHIFNTEFNISFFIPKKDQCDICESYKNAVDQEKVALEDIYKEHQKQKMLSRKEKAKDIRGSKEFNSSTIVAIYDLQAVMPVPQGESSAFFYKSKLNCYNFTVTDVKHNTTTCYFWHEGLGNRGAIEIGSCVYKFLEDIAESCPGCDLIFFSDNCCGQQKNRFILAMYLYAVSMLNINSVTHKFLVRGHTQNEGDNAHSIIEKAIKKAKKSGPIYVPSQYVQIIRNAKKTGNAYIVKELNYDDFFELKTLSEDIGMNSANNIDGDTIKLTEISMVRFIKNSDTYEYKTSYEQTTWIKVPLKLRTGRLSRKDTRIEDVTLKQAYSQKINISERKKKDLAQLLKENIIPKQYSYFYYSLF